MRSNDVSDLYKVIQKYISANSKVSLTISLLSEENLDNKLYMLSSSFPDLDIRNTGNTGEKIFPILSRISEGF